VNTVRPGDDSKKHPEKSRASGERANRKEARPRTHGEVLMHGVAVHPAHAPPDSLGCSLATPLRVLIADDCVDAAESLEMLLSESGVETQVTIEGDQAMVRASKWRPHVCVIDIEMPGLGGCDIARSIRGQHWSERPLLIALTGWTSAQERLSALEAGFDHYLTKPVEPAKLVRIIQNYLGGMPT
jgi:CheY-like chemotaxis protein